MVLSFRSGLKWDIENHRVLSEIWFGPHTPSKHFEEYSPPGLRRLKIFHIELCHFVELLSLTE